MSCCGGNQPTYSVEIKEEIAKDGRFVRQKNVFTTPFGNGEGEKKKKKGCTGRKDATGPTELRLYENCSDWKMCWMYRLSEEKT